MTLKRIGADERVRGPRAAGPERRGRTRLDPARTHRPSGLRARARHRSGADKAARAADARRWQ